MDNNHVDSHQGTSLTRILVLFLFAGIIIFASSIGTYYYMNNQMQTKENAVITPLQLKPTIQQVPITDQQIVSTSTNSKEWKTIQSETPYGSNSKFSIQYPPDWNTFSLGGGIALEYKKWLGVPVNQDSCLITLGEGGSGDEGSDVVVEESSKNYGDLFGSKSITKKGGKISYEATVFSRDNIGYLFRLMV